MSDLKKQLCENDLNKFVCCSDPNELVNCCFYNPVTNEACCPPKYIELNVDWFTKHKELQCCIDESAFPICLENINYDPTPLLTTNDCGFEVFNPNNIIYTGNFCAYKGLIASRSEKEACLKPPTEIFVVFKKFCYLTYGSTNCDPSCGFYVPSNNKAIYRWQCDGPPPYQTCGWVPHFGPCSDLNSCLIEDCRKLETLQQCLNRIFCEKEPSLCGSPPEDYLLEVPCVLDKSKINNTFLSIIIAIPSKNIYFVDVKEIDDAGNLPPDPQRPRCINFKDPNTGEIISFDFNVSGQACLVPPGVVSPLDPNFQDKIEFEVDTCHYTDKDHPDVTFRLTYLEYQITAFGGCACPDCDRRCVACCDNDVDKNKAITSIEVELSNLPEDDYLNLHALNNQKLIFDSTETHCEYVNISSTGGTTCRRTYFIKTTEDRSCFYTAEENFCFSGVMHKFFSKLRIEWKVVVLEIYIYVSEDQPVDSCFPSMRLIGYLRIVFRDESSDWKCSELNDLTLESTIVFSNRGDYGEIYAKKITDPINLKLRVNFGELKCFRENKKPKVDFVKGKQKIIVDPLFVPDFHILRCMGDNGYLHLEHVDSCYDRNDFIGSRLVARRSLCPDSPAEYTYKPVRSGVGPYILHAGQYLVPPDKIRNDLTKFYEMNVPVVYVELSPPQVFTDEEIALADAYSGCAVHQFSPGNCSWLPFTSFSQLHPAGLALYCANIAGVYPLYCSTIPVDNVLGISGVYRPNFLTYIEPDISPDLIDPETGCTPHREAPKCDVCPFYRSNLYRSVIYAAMCQEVWAVIPFTYMIMLGPFMGAPLRIFINVEYDDPAAYYRCRLCTDGFGHYFPGCDFPTPPYNGQYVRYLVTWLEIMFYGFSGGSFIGCDLGYFPFSYIPDEYIFIGYDRCAFNIDCGQLNCSGQWKPASEFVKLKLTP